MDRVHQKHTEGRVRGRELVEQKVDDFARHEKEYKSKDFKETTVRSRFIDPFFQALGWDFDQTGVARHLWDVHEERSQKDYSAHRSAHQSAQTIMRPDYTFRHKGKTKFFVEAKAPHVDLTAKDPVFQAKSYAFSTNGKAPIVILTDFEEFRVFNALERPIFDNPLDGLISKFDLKYRQYLDHWNSLYDVFSKEAVGKNSLAALVGKVHRLTKTLDREFLADLTRWRELLARKVALDNVGLAVEQINECVQRILDRLVFIRNLEDREIEQQGFLHVLSAPLSDSSDSKEGIYSRLVPIFERLDREYNGLIFKKHLSDEIIVDDRSLREIILQLYPRKSPYRFDVIEPEILGRIYEKFLGSKIRLTEAHRAKVEEKPEVRHAGGVYYTPEWVVDHIVENTVGKLIAGKTPLEIEQLKILDPACGSGSFLLGTFSSLIEYHEGWYENYGGSARLPKQYRDDFYVDTEGRVSLRLRKKAAILKNNIFGVDIDREATEVAIMSLYLKLLDQGRDSGQGELMGRGFLLPEMEGNIRQGNSLIDRDMLLDRDLFGDEDIRPFDWQNDVHGFGNIFKEGGGFDCIIGNPPYIRIQEMQKWAPKTVGLYKGFYKAGSQKNYDIYVLFFEKIFSILNDNGICGYITPNKYLQQEYGENLRKLIADGKHLKQIVNFKHSQVFTGATTYTCITLLTKHANKSFQYTDSDIEPSALKFSNIETYKLSGQPWNFYSAEDMQVMSKIADLSKLESLCDNIFVGIQTSADKVFILDLIKEKRNTLVLFSKSLDKEVELGKNHIRHIISGADVKRYREPPKRQFVIYPYDIENGSAILLEKKYIQKINPTLWEYLLENKKILENREKGRLKGKGWWGYIYLKNMARQNHQKLCVPRLVQKIQCIFDENGNYCLDNVDVGGVILKKEYKHLYHYIMGVLNSSLLSFVLGKISTPFRGGFYSCNRQYLSQLPIYIPDPSDQPKFALCQKIEKYAKDILAFKKAGRLADADFLEKKIDEMVRELYGV